MTTAAIVTWISVAAHLIAQFTFAVRAVVRPQRDPSSRMAWVVLIFAAPVVGILAYLLLGEVNIGRRRILRLEQAKNRLPSAESTCAGWPEAAARELIPDRRAHLFKAGAHGGGYVAVGGNSGELLADSDATIDAMVRDIDQARDHVHVLFYIWLADNNGLRIAEALMRATRRGVTCRAMADDLGSRHFIRSAHWRAMETAGVRVARALPIGNPLLRMLRGRIDLRNHRKIVVIDHDITYCGSQNCADPEFRIKAKYAPWVDATMRFEGTVARQNQHLFACDWMGHVDEDLSGLFDHPLPERRDGFAAQVIGTGPMVPYSIMPEVFETLMYAARHELVIATPYYVPDESMQAALCAAARRGVATMLILPARNDSWIVAAASHSYYADLLRSGVRIFEYRPGLLHAKLLTIDGDVTLIGSANLDRRSFDLNFENNILLHDPDVTEKIRERQEAYMAESDQVTLAEIETWNWPRQLWNNAVAMMGPVL